MSRLPRLVIAHRAHYVIQRGHSGQAVFADDTDRQGFLAALREAAATQRVAVHAYALLDNEVHLLATPADAVSLGRMVQTLGRRYVGAYNRRHGRSGTLWDGRFRCAVVEPGVWQLAALRLIDGLPGLTSAAHRTGEPRDTMLADPPEFWQLGNTPFEREAAYRTLLVQGVDAPQAAALRSAALGGWAVGSASFIAQLAAQTARPVRPRPRGRPAAR
jgi:putative transposase